MANIGRTGFHPFGNTGSTSTQVVRRRVASNNGTAFFTGDCMKRTAAGVWGLATVAAGNPVSSVCQGASYFDSTINGRRENTYLPVSTTYSSTAADDYGNTDESFVYLCADPVNTRFLAQFGTAAAAATLALNQLTLNADWIAGAGSTTTGLSGHVIDSGSTTTPATTANLGWSIDDYWHNVKNDITVAAPQVVVRINVGGVPPFNSAGTLGV